MNYINHNKILILLVILFSSWGTTLSNYVETLPIITLYAIYIFQKKGLSVDPQFVLISIVIIFLSFIYFIFFTGAEIIHYIGFYLRVLLAYLVIKINNEKFIDNLIDVSYKLALLSLPFYFLQLFFPSVAFSIYSTFNQIINVSNSLQEPSIIIQKISPIQNFRNFGFAHEPSYFGTFLNLILFIKLSRDSFKMNRETSVLLIAIISTVSTAATVGLFIIVFYFIMNRKKKIVFRFLLFPIFVITIITVWEFDYMSGKITQAIEIEEMTMRRVYDPNRTSFMSLGKFGSALVDFQDWTESPLIGYGLSMDERFQGRSFYLNRTNGLSDYLVTFGLVGFIFLLFAVNKFTKHVPFIADKNFKILFIILLLEGSIGDGYLDTPLFFFFQLYYIANIGLSYRRLSPQTVEQMNLKHS